MDVDALASEFGSGGKSAPPATDDSGIDVHALAAEFGSKGKKAEPTKTEAITIRPVAPPISGDIGPLPQPETTIAGGVNPRSQALAEGIRNYIPAIGEAIKQNVVEGGQTFSSGMGDIVNQGELASGAKKMGLGALQAVTAIPAGIASEGVGKPVANITGELNQDIPRYPDPIYGTPTGEKLANPASIGERAAFVAGSAIPVAPGLATLSKLRPSNVAFKDLVDIITNNGANPENLVPVVKGMKANPRLGPADLNPAVLSTTQKLFTTEGDAAKNYLASTSANRVATSKNAVGEAYDATAGIPVSAIQKLKDLAEASKKVGNEQINPAVAGAKPVDLSPVIEHIDKQLKPGVNSVISQGTSLPFTAVKQQLAQVKSWLANKNEMRTGADDLNRIQSAFRVEAENLLSSSDGATRALGSSLMAVRNKIVEAIDKAAGGKYKPALEAYKDEKHIGDAFHNAFNGVFTNSKKLENLPEFTEQWVKGLSEHELEAAREGARLAIYREMGQAKNPALAGTNLAKSDFNKQRLEILFGKKEAGDLLQKLEHERLIANTHNKIVENSQTAMRSAGESKVELTPPKQPKDALHRAANIAGWVGPEVANYYGSGYAVPGLGLALSGAGAVINKLATHGQNKITRALELEKNLQLAKMALPNQGPERDALIQALEAAIPGPKQSLVRRGAGTLSRLVQP